MRNMIIHELAEQSGVPAKSIRYYESIGVLPRPKQTANNYRQYREADVERLRFLVSARSLGFSLHDIGKILAARDNGTAPCERVLETIAKRLADVDRRIADLLAMRDALDQLQHEGSGLPRTNVNGEPCICDLLTSYRDKSHVAVRAGTFLDG